MPDRLKNTPMNQTHCDNSGCGCFGVLGKEWLKIYIPNPRQRALQKRINVCRNDRQADAANRCDTQSNPGQGKSDLHSVTSSIQRSGWADSILFPLLFVIWPSLWAGFKPPVFRRGSRAACHVQKTLAHLRFLSLHRSRDQIQNPIYERSTCPIW